MMQIYDLFDNDLSNRHHLNDNNQNPPYIQIYDVQYKNSSLLLWLLAVESFHHLMQSIYYLQHTEIWTAQRHSYHKIWHYIHHNNHLRTLQMDMHNIFAQSTASLHIEQCLVYKQ